MLCTASIATAQASDGELYQDMPPSNYSEIQETPMGMYADIAGPKAASRAQALANVSWLVADYLCPKL